GGESRALLQMLREKFQAARPGDVGAGLVVAGALVAMEAVLGARIDEDLNVRSFRLDGLDVGQGNAGVLLAEMQLRRRLRRLFGKALDRAAVITDRRFQARQPRRRGKGDAAAEAKADDADRAEVLDRIDRGLGIA